MIGIIIVSIVVIVLVTRFLNRSTQESIPRSKSTFDEFEKAGIYLPDDPRVKEFEMKSIVKEETPLISMETNQDSNNVNYFKIYYNLYKDCDYEDLKDALNVDNKENYSDYTIEEKQRWHAVKVLMGEREAIEFRDYFIKKEFLKETHSEAIKFKMQQIDFKERYQKMEVLPDEIKEEAANYADELANKQLIDLLKSKTVIQLENYMNKRGLSSFSEQLRNYYYFRQHFMFNENKIKNDIQRLKGMSDRAKNEETMRATREDYHKLRDELKWIMEGFFDLSEEEQKHPPKRDFFKSQFLDNI